MSEPENSLSKSLLVQISQKFPFLSQLNILRAKDRKKALRQLFLQKVTSNYPKTFLKSFFSGGLYLVKEYQKSSNELNQIVAIRKLSYYKETCSKIEQLRNSISFKDPKVGIRLLEKRLGDTEFYSQIRSIFSKSDLLLFITTPAKNLHEIEQLFEGRKTAEIVKTWRNLKKELRTTEIELIKKINKNYASLKQRHCLSKQEINLKLLRSSIGKQSPGNLTVLSKLLSAFAEIQEAYEVTKCLMNSRPHLYNALGFFTNLSTTDCERIKTELLAFRSNNTMEISTLLKNAFESAKTLFEFQEAQNTELLFLVFSEHQLEIANEVFSRVSIQYENDGSPMDSDAALNSAARKYVLDNKNDPIHDGHDDGHAL